MRPILLLCFLSFLFTSCSDDVADDDSCRVPTSLNASVYQASATLGWSQGNEDFYTVQWGPLGFGLGNGTSVNAQGGSYTLNSLSGGEYSFYVASNCGGSMSDWAGPKGFTVSGNVCDHTPSSLNATNSNSLVYLSWYDAVSLDLYHVEYGVRGFTVGNGTFMAVSSTNAVISVFQPSTEYDFYVRGVCNGGEGAWSGPHSFITPATGGSVCPEPTNFSVTSVTTSSINYDWSSGGLGTNSYQFEIGNEGFTLGTGSDFETANSSIGIINLQGNRSYDAYVRARCELNEFSDWHGPLTVSTD